MLNVFRENFREKPWLKLVLALVGVTMIGYLGNYFFGDSAPRSSTAWVARVNGTEIPDWAYREEARRHDERARQMLGPSYAQFRNQLGIREQALDTVIAREVMRQDARRLGLTCAPEELADAIRSLPDFQDPGGQFIGAERYRQMVQRGVPGGIAAFEKGLADQLVAQKWINLVSQPASVSEEQVQEQFRRNSEKTAIDYAFLAATPGAGGSDVGEDELRRAYDADPDRYRRGEGRPIRYVVIRRDAQRSAVQVGPEEIRRHYEQNAPRFTHAEQRRASQILMRVAPGSSDAEKARVRAATEALQTRVASGEDFAALARASSEDAESAAKGGDIGWVARGETLPAIEQAIWNTPVGGVAPPVEGPTGGFLLIKVTAERPAGVAPLEEVEGHVRQNLEIEGSQARLATEAARIRAEITDASKLGEVAQREGLPVETHFAPAGSPLREIGASPDLAAAVAELEPGQVSAPLPIASGLAIVTTEALQPPQVAPFEEVRDRVREDLLAERGRRAALATVRAALDRQQDLARAAKSLDLEVRSQDLAQGQALPGSGGTTTEMTKLLFSASTAVGQRGAFEVPAGAILYQVTRRDPFDEARFQAEKAALLESALAEERSRHAELVLGRLREAQTIEINQAKVDEIGPGRG